MGLVLIQVISVLGAVLAGLLVPLFSLGFFVPKEGVYPATLLFSIVALNNIISHFRTKQLSFKRLKNWFSLSIALELICLVPLIGLLLDMSVSERANLLLFNLFFLRHLLKVPIILDYFSEIKPLTYRLVPLSLLLPLLLHIITCGWLFLGGGSGGMDGSQFDQYVRALYWAFATLTTVGYGDITAQTNWQMLYSCFVGLTGVGFYGYMISNIASLLARQDAARERHMTQLENMENYLNFHQIPKNLQRQVRDYYRFLWTNKKSFEQLDDIETLPIPLQSQLFFHINRKSLEKIPFLKSATENVFTDLMSQLETQIVVPGEYLFKKGEPGDYLYFIQSGEIDIKTGDGQTIASLRKGDFFGEHALLSSEPRNATALAKEYSGLFKLSKGAFNHVLSKHPDFKRHIESIDKERQLDAS